MALSRIKVWITERLNSADLNAEFNNVLNNALSLISPLTGNLAAGGNDITGVDELALDNAGADASAAGRIRRNSTRVTWHNGTAAKNLAYTDEPGLIYISTTAASNSATVDITSGFSSTYDQYLITITDIIPQTDDTDLWMRVSQSAVFVAGATDYRWSRMQCSDAGTVTGAGSTGDTKFLVANQLGTGTGETYSGRIYILNPAGTAKYKLVHAHSTWFNSAPVIATGDMTGAFVLNTTAIDGIRFLMSSGNIVSGTFALYGVRKT